jgi:O-antigen/teichoic acid export membrane protein
MTMDSIQEKTDTAKKLVKNSAWLFLAEILSKLTALGIQIIAARYLGEKGFGVFGFAFIATGIVLDFIDNGLKVFLTRAISRNPDVMDDYLRNIFALKWVLSFASILIFLVAIILFPLDSETLKVISIIGLALIFNGYTEMYLGVFRAYEQMLLVSKLMVFQRIMFFVFGLFVLLTGYQVVAFSTAFLISTIISFFLARMQLNKSKLAIKKRFDRALIRKIFNDSLPICGVVFFSYIYFCIDSVLLFLMVGKSGTGWYFAAFKIIESLALLLASVRGALFPVFSRTSLQDNDRFMGLWREAAKFLIIIGLPISAGTAVLAPQLIDVLYGPRYEITGLLLQIMALPFFLLVLNEFIAYLLLSADKTDKVLKITIVGAIFNIVCNLLVIPKWGLVGAAVVAGLTELLIFILFFQTINKSYGRTSFVNLVWKPTVATVGMSLVIVQASWSVIPSFLIGVGVYFVSLFLLRTFNEQDFQVMRNIFNRAG